MKPELETRFVFGKRFGSTIVEVSNDNVDVIIHIREEEEKQDEGSYLFLDPEEIEIFIATLKLYKYKILNPRKVKNEDE